MKVAILALLLTGCGGTSSTGALYFSANNHCINQGWTITDEQLEEQADEADEVFADDRATIAVPAIIYLTDYE